MEDESVYQLFHRVAVANSDGCAYRYKRDGTWIDVSWSETQEKVRQLSKSLIAAGVKKGDRVCILAKTRFEWVLCDFGIVTCGGVTVGIYPSNLPPDCAYIIRHCDAEVIFVEDRAQLDKVLEVRGELAGLRQIVILDGPSEPDQGISSWQDFLARGNAVTDEQADLRGKEIGPDDLASIVYTSGTTGVPKGAMLSNRNLIFTVWTAGQSLYLEPHYSTLMFLPLAHVFARLITYCCMQYPVPLAFAEDITTVAADLRETRPEFIVSVPRIYEKIYDKILGGAEAAGGLKQKLFHWAVDTGRQVSVRIQAKQPIPAGLKIRHALADKLVLKKIRAALGGSLVWAVSGAAPLNKAIAEFFHACGVTILEGIGMTENTSFSHVNRLHHNKFGTVGQPGPRVETRLAGDGEVLIRGENVMVGYFRNPEATQETIDDEGWLHTGDIGEIDDEGFLRITDRKKDLIITAGGKNVAPQRIEKIMRTSRYIASAVAYGDKRKFISALFTLDAENIAAWAAEQGLPTNVEELADHPRVRELIEKEVEERNRQLASFESIKRFQILDRDFTIEDGEMTPTLKIKRKVVFDKHREALEALYGD